MLGLEQMEQLYGWFPPSFHMNVPRRVHRAPLHMHSRMFWSQGEIPCSHQLRARGGESGRKGTWTPPRRIIRAGRLVQTEAQPATAHASCHCSGHRRVQRQGRAKPQSKRPQVGRAGIPLPFRVLLRPWGAAWGAWSPPATPLGVGAHPTPASAVQAVARPPSALGGIPSPALRGADPRMGADVSGRGGPWPVCPGPVLPGTRALTFLSGTACLDGTSSGRGPARPVNPPRPVCRGPALPAKPAPGETPAPG